MIYPIKILDQLSLFLKDFRKAKRLTQAAMAERLGITQQSYAYFEANPNRATMERLFLVLRLLDVEITLYQTPLSVPSHKVGAMSKKLKPVKTTQKGSTAAKKGKLVNNGAPQKTMPVHLDGRSRGRILARR